jgi:ATP-binding protein involved in chromosome partitioning
MWAFVASVSSDSRDLTRLFKDIKSMIAENDIHQALSRLHGEGEEQDIIASGRVQGVVIKDGNIGFSLDVGGLNPDTLDALKQQAEATIRDLKGVLSVTCVMTAHKQGGDTKAGADAPKAKKPAREPNQEVPEVFQRIGMVLAVASGKGGVGKSTIAVNLALALQQAGKRVGLLDADIYGPSAPQLLNITERPDVTDEKKLIPIDRHGVATMSIGYMVPPEQAMIWRGPMVQGAVIQMLNDVEWPELDILVLDMPPGTGDIQLTMAQRIPVTGALIVSTPSSLALADVVRAIGMFEKVNIPVLGMVENMAYMQAPDGSKLFPFGEGGSDAMAQQTGIACLASLALDPALQHASETGIPAVVADMAGDATHAFAALADRVLTQLDKKGSKK